VILDSVEKREKEKKERKKVAGFEESCGGILGFAGVMD